MAMSTVTGSDDKPRNVSTDANWEDFAQVQPKTSGGSIKGQRQKMS